MADSKVKIHYGIFGGEQLGKRLRQELRAAGYEVTRDETVADIIVAHSAGCFWLPKAPTHQKLLLIDPPYWPEKTLGERGRQKMKTNFRYRQFGYSSRRWFAKHVWSAYYAIRDLNRTLRIFRHAPSYDLEQIIKDHQVLLVRNEFDAWLTDDLEPLRLINPRLKIKIMSGEHDDWYFNPKPYVDLLQLLHDKR